MPLNCGAGEKSPLDCKEIKPVNPKGNQPWIIIGRINAEALILWLPDAKSWLTGKDPDVGKDGGQEEKGTTEDEMVGWCHWLNGREFEQALGVGDGQESLACCSSVVQLCPNLYNLWTAAHQASLSFTNSWSLLKLTSIESVKLSDHFILCYPFFSCFGGRIFTAEPLGKPRP